MKKNIFLGVPLSMMCATSLFAMQEPVKGQEEVQVPSLIPDNVNRLVRQFDTLRQSSPKIFNQWLDKIQTKPKGDDLLIALWDKVKYYAVFGLNEIHNQESLQKRVQLVEEAIRQQATAQ